MTPNPSEERPENASTGKTWQRVALIFIGAAVAGPLIGIWIGKQLLARRERTQRPEPAVEPEPQRIEIPITPSIIPPEPAAPAETEEATAPDEGVAPVYVGSDERDKYHVDGCRWAGQIRPENRIVFESCEEAEARGYTPCGTCHPDRQASDL